MDIVLMRERGADEKRVALVPSGIGALVAAGHRLEVESDAGREAGFPNEEYEEAGATIAWSPEEALAGAELAVKLERPGRAEVEALPDGGQLAAFCHLAAAPEELLRLMAERRLTVFAFEMLEMRGDRPLVTALAEIAGRLCPQIAARWLETASGGPGVLLSGVPGIPPAEVVVLGAGVVGRNAARGMRDLGARVTLMDNRVPPLRRAEQALGGRGIRCLLADSTALWRSMAYADVLIGAVYRSGGLRAPKLVTEEMVRAMRTGAVIIDLAIDEGGCVATSRPTTLADPVFRQHGVVHCCLPNVTALVGRTASKALSATLTPLLADIPERFSTRLGIHRALAYSAVMVGGRPTRPAVAERLGVEAVPLDEALEAVWI